MRCSNCFAPLTQEEKFYLQSCCERCDRDARVVQGEAHLPIKSPRYLIRWIQFCCRRCWFRLQGQH